MLHRRSVHAAGPLAEQRIQGDDAVDLWAQCAGSTPWLLIDFINITAWPSSDLRHFRQGLAAEPARISSLLDATAHVVVAVETHVKDDDLQDMLDHISARKRWIAVAAPARPSDKSEKGSHGGAVMCARSYLASDPTDAAKQVGKGRYVMMDTFWRTELTVQVLGIPVSIIGGYCRGGICTVDGTVFMTQLVHRTRGGNIPFLALVDWNAEPAEFWNNLAGWSTCRQW